MNGSTLSSTKSLIAHLVSMKWSIRAIAHSLNVTERTIHRWKDKGASFENKQKLALLSNFNPAVFGTLIPYGVCYLQREGEPLVRIGETQDIGRTLKGFQNGHAVPVRVVAWHPNTRVKVHRDLWEAHKGPFGGWFHYHPDMEQQDS